MLTILPFLKAIWISLDIDESYAVAVGCPYGKRGQAYQRHVGAPFQWMEENSDGERVETEHMIILKKDDKGLAQ